MYIWMWESVGHGLYVDTLTFCVDIYMDVGICVSRFMCRSQRTTRKKLFCLPLPSGSWKFNSTIRLAANSFTQWAITPALSEVVNRFVSRCSCRREVCNYDLIILPPYGSSVFKNLGCRNSCGVSGTWCVYGSWAETLLRPLQVVSLVKSLNMSSDRPERTGLVSPGQARPDDDGRELNVVWPTLRRHIPTAVLGICSWFLLYGSETSSGCGRDVAPFPLSSCFWLFILLMVSPVVVDPLVS